MTFDRIASVLDDCSRVKSWLSVLDRRSQTRSLDEVLRLEESRSGFAGPVALDRVVEGHELAAILASKAPIIDLMSPAHGYHTHRVQWWIAAQECSDGPLADLYASCGANRCEAWASLVDALPFRCNTARSPEHTRSLMMEFTALRHWERAQELEAKLLI